MESFCTRRNAHAAWLNAASRKQMRLAADSIKLLFTHRFFLQHIPGKQRQLLCNGNDHYMATGKMQNTV
ncbi:hypothetical protein BUE76_09070 [Cnuella takakiae]|nr:hypothetical protein BUE76_09070 [Cnuella takakiae]